MSRHPQKLVPPMWPDRSHALSRADGCRRRVRVCYGLALADRRQAAHVLTMTIETVGYAPPRKRSILISGHPTSISLEPLFWHALEIAAQDTGRPVNALVAEIDSARMTVESPPNLTSAIRQWLFARALSG